APPAVTVKDLVRELVDKRRKNLSQRHAPVDPDKTPGRDSADCRRKLLEPKLNPLLCNEHEKTVQGILRVSALARRSRKRLTVCLAYIKNIYAFKSKSLRFSNLVVALLLHA